MNQRVREVAIYRAAIYLPSILPLFALIFLASLRAVPSDLYESAALDGAGALRRFRHITLPLITPVILYDLIYGTILGFQIFTPAYILVGGTSGGAAYTAGPDNSLLFYVFYLYKNAFQYSDMGYASAMAWVLFVISVVLALAIMRWSKYWVYYEAA